MKTLHNQIGLFFMFILLAFSVGCKKAGDSGQLPQIITSVVDIVTPVSAICSGNIGANGGSTLSERARLSMRAAPD